MASYTISPIWGAGAQLFDNSGNVLTGGKIYTYLAGTTTPATTYTTPTGSTANSNPIVANAAGRLTNEIWFPVSGAYKFVLKDADDVLIATYDNIPTTPQPLIVNDASSISYDIGYIVNAGNFTIGETYRIDTVGTTDFVAIGAGGNVNGVLFTATGVGSGTGTAEYVRTVENKLRETVSVKDFGAVGDGVTDDTAAIQAAIDAATSVLLVDGEYKITSQLTISDNTSFFGTNRQSAKLVHAFNGNMILLGNNASISNMYIDGQGTTYTGKGIICSGTDGGQIIQNCKIINFDDNCIYFASTAGSQSSVINVITSQTYGTSGSNKYAILIEDVASVTAVPRKFTQIETNGYCSFSFGGSNDTFVTASFLGDIAYTANSRAVLISTSRIANQTTLSIKGANNTIVGCAINPSISIDGVDNIALTGNSYNNLPIVNNTGNGRNLIDQWAFPYTPTFASGGTAPSLGDGSLNAYFSYSGSICNFGIQFLVGSTTTLGTGDLRFGTPCKIGLTSTCGQARIIIGGVNYTAVVVGSADNSYISLIRDTSGSVTFNNPAVFSTGDIINISGSFFYK